MASKVTVYASPADVRAYAQKNGIAVGTRGKFSKDLISAYNKSHGVKYVEGKHVARVKVTAKPEKGRSVTRSVNMGEVRAAALDAGLPVGKRGRIAEEVVNAYVLGTLDTLASQPDNTITAVATDGE